MADDDKPKPPPPQPIKIDGPYQSSSIAILGLALMFTGIVAVFKTTVEAGPVAMMGIGVLLFLIGVSRQLPTRLKAGDYEAEWSAAVTDALNKVIDEVPPERLPAVERAIHELARTAPTVAASAHKSIVSERELLERVRQAALEVGATLTPDAARLDNGARADAVVEANGKKLWVTVSRRYLKGWELGASQSLVPKIKELDPTFVGNLIVAPPRDGGDPDEVRGLPGEQTWYVWILQDQGHDRIATVMRTALLAAS